MAIRHQYNRRYQGHHYHCEGLRFRQQRFRIAKSVHRVVRFGSFALGRGCESMRRDRYGLGRRSYHRFQRHRKVGPSRQYCLGLHRPKADRRQQRRKSHRYRVHRRFDRVPRSLARYRLLSHPQSPRPNRHYGLSDLTHPMATTQTSESQRSLVYPRIESCHSLQSQRFETARSVVCHLHLADCQSFSTRMEIRD